MSTSQVNHARQFSIVFWQILTYALLLIATMLVAFPLFWMVVTSLKPDLHAVLQIPPSLIPDPPTWENFARAWQAAPFGRYTLNSIIVSSSVVVLQVFNACLTAYVFARIKFRGRDLLFVLFLITMMVPSQVTVVPLYGLLTKLGWLDSYQGLIIPFAASSFGTFLIRQAFLSIPEDMIDAATIDGAGHFQILRHVMIPLSRPAIIAFALLTFKWRWNDYFWVLIMTSSDAMRTLPIGVVMIRAGAEGGSSWHIVMAATIIVLLPLLIIFAIGQKYFVEGVTHTGMKG